MSSTGHCERCGTRLPSGLLGNRCPRCLLESALSDVEEQDEKQAQQRPEPAAVTHPAGRHRFGDYELLEEIGRGGMGVVYKARQLSLHRIVAVKMLLSGTFASAEFIRRFQAEAEAAADLHHPNIVAIHDFGECEGQNYFSMEYVPGRNLAEIIREKPLPPKATARYVQTIAAAISYAHRHCILHRDLKPSNIIIDAEDQPRITDFGLAKRMTLEEDMTLSGQAIGSPNYMPPEQASGQRDAIGPASDIFSIGAILYHLLTGRPPFLAETVTSTLRQVQEAEPVSPRLINPVVPRDLETVCLKCMEKDPRHRYQTAEELASELERYLRGEPIRTRPVSLVERAWRWCRRNPKLAAMASAVVVLGIALLVGTPVALFRIEQERKAALRHATEATRQSQLADSALYRFEIQHAQDLFASDRAPEAVALLASLVRERPNDRAVAEWLMNELTYRSFAMPTVEPLRHDDMVFFAQFSADGRRLLTVCRNNSARVWDPMTGQPITPLLQHDASLVHPGEFLGPTQPLFARFSPDGTRVVTASIDRTARVWDAVTGKPVTRPLPHGAGVSCAQFTLDGKLIATGCKDGKVQFWDAVTGEPTGPALQHSDEVNTIEFSPNGQWMVTASEDRTAQVWDKRTGQPVGQRLLHRAQVRAASFSPDGQKVITISRDYTARLWLAASGEPATPTLQHDGVVNSAQFSPDGLWLVTSSFDKTARVWDVESGRPIGIPLQHRGTVRSARFSPDGLRVVTASEDGTTRVWEARTGRPLTESMKHEGAVWWAAFAPDGWRVATACLDKSVGIWDVRLRQPLFSRQMETSVKAMEWSSDGQRVLCAAGDTEAWSCDAPGGDLQLRWRFSSAPKSLRSAHYSMDGQRVVIASEDQTARILDAEAGSVLVPNLRHEGIVSDAQFSPDGKWVVTVSAGTARIWDAHTGQAQFEPLRHADVIHAFEFSPDGRQVVTASADKEARIWSVSTGKLMVPPLVHSNAVTLASFSRDGQRILTVSQDNRARLWDAHTGTALGQPLTHDSLINSARFSSDGRLVVTASRDNTGRVWDGQTGQPVTGSLVHDGVVVTADFTPDGQKVFTASEDGTIRLWDARTGLPQSGSFKQKKGIRCAQISPDGRWLAFGCADWTLSVVELISAPLPVPGWLPELAEAVAARKLNRQRALESVAAGELLRWKARVDGASPADPCLAWAKWFLADPVHRSIFPSSAILTESILGQRTDQAWFDGRGRISPLEEALQITPNDGWIYAQLARLIALYGPTNGPSRLARVDWFSRRAIELMPQDAITWWARAVYFECLGDLEAAVAAMERASQFGSNNVYFWRAKANLLEKAGRIDAACDAFTQLIKVAEQEWQFYSYAPFLRQRAAFLERHGRLAEARADRLRAQGVNPRHPQTPAHLIDLWQVYNAGLDEVLAWQMNEFTLGPVPRGRQQLAGVEFDLRGLVRLASASSADQPQRFPREAEDIPVHQLCHRLHFLHAADTSEAEGAQIGSYVVRGADGTRFEVPIIYGKDVVAWNTDPPHTNSRPVVAWNGRNRLQVPVQLFLTSWENPRPDVMIETIDFLSNDAKAAPFLVAITGEP